MVLSPNRHIERDVIELVFDFVFAFIGAIIPDRWALGCLGTALLIICTLTLLMWLVPNILEHYGF